MKARRYSEGKMERQDVSKVCRTTTRRLKDYNDVSVPRVNRFSMQDRGKESK